jgi:hypothetical protein
MRIGTFDVGSWPPVEERIMKSYRKEIPMNIPARMGFRNITSEVEAAVRESGVQERLCLVNPLHITASVFINDDEPGLHRDYARWLEEVGGGWSGSGRCAPAGVELARPERPGVERSESALPRREGPGSPSS